MHRRWRCAALAGADAPSCSTGLARQRCLQLSQRIPQRGAPRSAASPTCGVWPPALDTRL
jgi:hypothetical protein